MEIAGSEESPGAGSEDKRKTEESSKPIGSSLASFGLLKLMQQLLKCSV